VVVGTLSESFSSYYCYYFVFGGYRGGSKYITSKINIAIMLISLAPLFLVYSCNTARY